MTRQIYLGIAVAGAFAFAASIYALADGSGAVFDGGEVYRVIAVGWGGVLLSLAVTGLGALGVHGGGRIPAYYLSICAATGLLVGGTLAIAAFMVVALIASLALAFGYDRRMKI